MKELKSFLKVDFASKNQNWEPYAVHLSNLFINNYLNDLEAIVKFVKLQSGKIEYTEIMNKLQGYMVLFIRLEEYLKDKYSKKFNFDLILFGFSIMNKSEKDALEKDLLKLFENNDRFNNFNNKFKSLDNSFNSFLSFISNQEFREIFFELNIFEEDWNKTFDFNFSSSNSYINKNY
ncbi:hypothetical protein EELLY_v1c05990 [Entomoplasma ellychniae]|uniref:Uncharacterized protein n=1 Tax=Entomoplasma ellychniae TaxID=2114 RepID=A0A8E2QZ88_9MOLU|nr:hypothetical protein [Entomoplasma ellychniae]PPE04913.1 hypothetical protein EELLY_v1c05990 [Entomoplasma ellychniae]